MNNEQLAWVAGLLEGEGCFTQKTTKGSIRGSIAIACQMTDEDVLRRLHQYVGAGSLSGPYDNGPKCKPRWCFRISGESAYLLMKQLRPWMLSRRAEKIDSLIKRYEASPIKTFRFLHIETGHIEETTNAKEWYRNHGLNEVSLYKTLTGDRVSCHGWRRLQ